MIKEILAAIKTATGIMPVPFALDKIANGIVYSYYTTADDGAVSKRRLELNLVTLTLADADKYKDKIIGALVTEGDEEKIGGIYRCAVNGGGQLKNFETGTIHTMIYFDITEKGSGN
mgnify:CR=1 FL=1